MLIKQISVQKKNKSKKRPEAVWFKQWVTEVPEQGGAGASEGVCGP